MELTEIIEKMSSPEKLVNPQEIVNLRIEIAGLVDDLKMQEFEEKLAVSDKLSQIRKHTTSVEIAKAELEQTEIYRRYHNTKRLRERLNGFRADLRYKLELITNMKR